MSEPSGIDEPELPAERAERLRFALLAWIQMQTLAQRPMVDIQAAIWQLATESRHLVRAFMWLEESGYVRYEGAGPTVSITAAGERALARHQEVRRLG